MNTNNKIEIGDIVSVNFHVSRTTLLHAAEVIHVPQATGDSWIFKDISKNFKNDKIHYVSEGCTISLIQKKD